MIHGKPASFIDCSRVCFVFSAVSCYPDIITTTSPDIPRTRLRASALLLQRPRRGHLLSRKNVYFRIQSVLAHRKEHWSKSAISIMCGPFQYLDIPEPSPRYEGCSNYPELHLASLSAAHHTSAALQCMQWHAHHLWDIRVHRWMHQRLLLWRYNNAVVKSGPPFGNFTLILKEGQKHSTGWTKKKCVLKKRKSAMVGFFWKKINDQ